MSKIAQPAKKAKTASALNRLVNPAFITAGLLLIVSLFLMPTQPSADGPYARACFQNGCLKLEDATTPQQRERGLSGRYNLAEGKGMLFVFDQPSKECMWMKQMRFSLDMVWLDQNNKIINIAKNLSPDTYPENFCAYNTKYVVEMNSGEADKLGLHVGDLMQL